MFIKQVQVTGVLGASFVRPRFDAAVPDACSTLLACNAGGLNITPAEQAQGATIWH